MLVTTGYREMHVTDQPVEPPNANANTTHTLPSSSLSVSPRMAQFGAALGGPTTSGLDAGQKHVLNGELGSVDGHAYNGKSPL